MIEISQLQESDKQRPVIYKSQSATGQWFATYMEDGRRIYCERGTISSWNENYVFVRYGSEHQAKATRPLDLEWEFESRRKELRDSLAREFECGYSDLSQTQREFVDRRVEQLKGGS